MQKFTEKLISIILHESVVSILSGPLEECGIRFRAEALPRIYIYMLILCLCLFCCCYILTSFVVVLNINFNSKLHLNTVTMGTNVIEFHDSYTFPSTWFSLSSNNNLAIDFWRTCMIICFVHLPIMQFKLRFYQSPTR